MAMTNVDPAIQMVMENVQVVVASEGGSIEVEGVSNGKLTVRYTPGVNEECPECVPDHELVRMMMKTSLSVNAPYITELEIL